MGWYATASVLLLLLLIAHYNNKRRRPIKRKGNFKADDPRFEGMYIPKKMDEASKDR